LTLVYKNDCGFVFDHKIIFTITHQERVRREKKGKEIDWETMVGEHTNYNWRTHDDILWIKINVLLCFIVWES